MFPKLKLPPDISRRDAIVMAPGQSFGDYELRHLQNCKAVLYGAGHVVRVMRLDHYALGDLHAHPVDHVIPDETTIHVTSTVIADATSTAPHLLKRFKPVDPHQVFSGSSGVVAMSLAANHGYERIFILGFDGLSDADGRARKFDGLYARSLPEKRHRPRRFIRQRAFEIHTAELLQIGVAAKLRARGVNLISLSAGCVLPIPISPHLERLPYGRIDRHGSLKIMIAPTDRLTNAIHLARFWRLMHPRQAIVVVSTERLTESPPDDIVVMKDMPLEADCLEFNHVETITFFDN